MSAYTKTSVEVLDYSFDWSGYSPDTISTSTFTVPAGLTKDSETNDATSSTVWLSGGTSGEDYTVICTVTTTAGRTIQKSFTLKVRDI